MQLPDKVYDVLKWVVMIVIPAVTTAYVGLASIWGWPYAEEIAKTSAVVCTLLGALLGISTAQYNKTGAHSPGSSSGPNYGPEVSDSDTGTLEDILEEFKH